MSGDDLEETFQLLTSLINEGRIEAPDILLLRKGWDYQALELVVFLEHTLEPLEVTETPEHRVNATLIVPSKLGLLYIIS